MIKSDIIIKNVKLTVSKDALDMIADAINSYLEDMETANEDLSLRRIDVGRLPHYKVDKGLCEHTRKWYIKYTRLATQLNRLNNKVLGVNDLHWKTKQQLERSK